MFQAAVGLTEGRLGNPHLSGFLTVIRCWVPGHGQQAGSRVLAVGHPSTTQGLVQSWLRAPCRGAVCLW